MISLDDTPAGDPETEIARLQLNLTRARENRIMAALWGSRDEDCPQPFSLYRSDDVTDDSPTGVIAYGVQFHNGAVCVRWQGDPLTSEWSSFEAMRDDLARYCPAQVVWLAEDLEDLTETLVEDIREKFLERLKSDATRVAVAEAISRADPVDSTWHDCLSLADAALRALVAVDEQDA